MEISQGKVNVPAEFRPMTNSCYPPYCNQSMIEQRFFQQFGFSTGKRIYIPVYWTNYYCNNGYEKGNHSKLHDFINSLPKDQKYYTIVQYDDGLLFKPEIDILTFAAGGKGDIPIPLLPSHNPIDTRPKTDFACFFGNKNNHPIRKKLTYHWLNTGENMDGYVYLNALARHKFALAPRGYGLTSFRLYEALSVRTIPVYISDEFWLPYSLEINWNDISILVKDSINLEEELITRMRDAEQELEYKYRQASINTLFERYFTMDGTISWIKNYLRNEG